MKNKIKYIDKVFLFIGIEVFAGGLCVPRNWFARFMCECAVRDNKFTKNNDGTYQLIK